MSDWETSGELENLLERALILTSGKTLQVLLWELRQASVEEPALAHEEVRSLRQAVLLA